MTVRKNRKQKDETDLIQYVDIGPLQGVQSQGIYKSFQQNPMTPTIVITKPSVDYRRSQTDQILLPYELPTRPSPAQLRDPS
ncbi:hypothetical protein RSOLAG22IIIB_03598 [Rhizoctonia solani]|uniref:Uncharacterized protein n=1 Tax=Rhizoctonia solani TaxID=456999 RepID=A0A0K6FRE9_9AGAM|nr:hypothetical protein RSOLAG22IIIB_03598 [Rhizoctonia solani]